MGDKDDAGFGDFGDAAAATDDAGFGDFGDVAADSSGLPVMFLSTFTHASLLFYTNSAIRGEKT